tara:strand:- start:17 stop:814 length:798 start_codon:yes stop_codon:yes gene_type:complete
MSESIKDINSGDLIVDDKTMVSIKDSSVNNFNLQNFIDDLKNNEKHLRDLKGQGILKRSWSRLTGENTSLIIQSLDLNNQFINFSLFINNLIIQNAKTINQNQKELANANQKIIENHEKINSTDKNLKTATERFNETTDRLQKISYDLDRLDSSKKELRTSIDKITKNISSIEKNVLDKAKELYDETDIAIKTIDKKQTKNSENIEKLINDIDKNSSAIESVVNDVNKHIADILEENHKMKRKLKGLLLLFMLLLITIGFLFYSL